ncbi:MAG: hypothetical protein ACFFEF_01215 [Candidatus Thorarchaeota archaeon]
MNMVAFVEGYAALSATSQHDSLYSATGRTILLHNSEDCRIYLTKGPESWEEVYLEIEVYLPMGCDTNQESLELNDFDSEIESLSRAQLLRYINYIEYLLLLEEHGFKIGVVTDECVLTARTILKDTPQQELLDLVTPP